MKLSNTKAWNLKEAVSFVQEIEVLIRPLGYFTGLTGGILHRGYSDKDLDLCIIPLSDSDISAIPKDDMRKIEHCLVRAGGTLVIEDVNVRYNRATRKIDIWQFGSKRVDVFYLGSIR